LREAEAGFVVNEVEVFVMGGEDLERGVEKVMSVDWVMWREGVEMVEVVLREQREVVEEGVVVGRRVEVVMGFLDLQFRSQRVVFLIEDSIFLSILVSKILLSSHKRMTFIIFPFISSD